MKTKIKHIINSFALLCLISCQTEAPNTTSKSITQKQCDSILTRYDNEALGGDTSNATTALKQVYAFDSLNVLNLCKLAIFQMQLVHLSSAKTLLNKAQKIGKYPAEVYYTRAIVYTANYPLDTVISYFDLAIKVSPDSIKYPLEKGMIYKQKKLYQQAIESFNEVLLLNKNNLSAYVSKTSIYYDTEQWEFTRDTATKAIKLVEQANKAHYYKLDELYYARGFAYMKLGNFNNALLDAEKSIQLDSSKGRFYTMRGFAKNNLGQKESSLEDMKKASELGDPEAIEIYNKYLEHKKNTKNI
jgi:tetratricopeptide (TPR) repeat protein